MTCNYVSEDELKMRSREIIIYESRAFSTSGRLSLEVLLDIRDLLTAPTRGEAQAAE